MYLPLCLQKILSNFRFLFNPQKFLSRGKWDADAGHLIK